MYDVSSNGVLVYIQGESTLRVAIVDRNGREQPLNIAAASFAHPRLSPSGDRVVLERSDGGRSDIWILTRATGQALRLTRDGVNRVPEWSADGSRVGWVRSDSTGTTLWWQRADGGGSPQRIDMRGLVPYHFQFMPDGKHVAAVVGTAFRHDIAIVPFDSATAPRMLADSPADEVHASVSPNGRWMAYTSTETGRAEVYVVSVDDPSTRLQLTTDGGNAPVWRDSATVMAHRRGALFSMSLSFAPRFEVTRRDTVPAFRYLTGGPDRWYDVSPVTGEFVVLSRVTSQRDRIVVVTGWFDELRRRLSQASPP
jgi:Tol biopolymer transport system component